jgi:Fe-S cluster assembly ATP-binding protein
MSVYATGANALATASSSSSSVARNIQRQTMMASTSSSSSSSSANYSSRNRVTTNVFRRRSSSSSSSSSLQRSSGKTTTVVRAKKGDVILEVSGLKAKVAETGEEILKGVDLIVREGETHAIMGKNGSGKSTLTKVLVGHPAYEVTGGTAKYKGEDLFEMEPEERARAGLFLSFQSPVEVPGVSNTDFLRMMCNERRKHRGEEEMDPLEFYGYLSPKLDKLNMDPSFMTRNVNEGFSGGEKKRNEILQLAVLESEMSILDEIDSGLDVDALRDVSEAVNGLKSDEKGLLLITHYQRLLDLIHPDVVHIMKKGKIVKTGDKSLASTIDEGGFAALG